MTTIPIVFATDENLIIQTGVCIYSLLSSCGQETQYDIYIITDYGKKMEALKGWVQLKNNPHCLDIHLHMKPLDFQLHQYPLLYFELCFH